MASALIAKPRTRTGGVLSGSTGIGYTSASSPIFYVKLRRITQQFGTNMVEVTGDGDTDPVYDNDEQIRSRFVIQGWMVNGAAVGLRNLSLAGNAAAGEGQGDHDATTATGLMGMTVNLSNSRKITYTFIRIEDVQIDFDTQAPFVMVVIKGVGHDTSRTAYEA